MAISKSRLMRRTALAALFGFVLLAGLTTSGYFPLPWDRDSDGDGLPDRVEASLGTDPYKADTDGDGLLDSWEAQGFVPAEPGTARAQPVPLPGANALRRDIYVEADWMRDATHSHEFRRNAISRVEDAFTRAPVNNPSGEMGVNIHIDTGQLGGGGDEIEHLPILAVGTGYIQSDGVGWEGQGAGIAAASIDNDPRPDIVLMAYDNPARDNSFRYKIAWNVNRDGNPTTWSGAANTPWSAVVQVAGVGWEGQGAGVRLIDLDGNGRPEMILMAYDNPAQANSFRYRIGWNVNAQGVAQSWSGYIQVAGVGNEGQGADVDFADLDQNGQPDMILMAYDNPAGANTYRYRIGWNVGANGQAAEWQAGYVTYPGTGNEGQGAGLAVVDLDGVRTDLLLLSYDNPPQANSFRMNIAYNLDAAGNAVHYDYYKARFFNPARANIYHYMIFAHDYWQGGSSSGLAFSNRDFIVTLGSWSGQTGTDNDQSGAFMHELGHNLGLGHGGNVGTNNKPNYPSIMNYNNTYTVDVDYDGAIDGTLDYSHGFLGALNENALDERAGVASYTTTEGVGWEGEGAGMALWDLDGNGIQDMILMAYDAPSGPNNIRYKVGFDLTARAVPRRWASAYQMLPGMGDLGEGADIALADLDGNGRPEMIVAVYDAPSGANNIRYRIGWNLNSKGKTSNWGRTIQIPGMGHLGQGLGLAVTNIDNDPRPDILFAVYDNPAQQNNFRFRVGWNVGPGGAVTSWSDLPQVDGVGWEGQGMGIAFANIDANPRPDLVLMAYDNPGGPNEFRVKIGWNVGTNGVPASWSGVTRYAGVGNEGQGAGIALADLNGNGRPEMIMMAYDNPAGANTFRYRLGQDITTSGGLGVVFGFPRDWNGNGTIQNSVSANINGDRDGAGNPVMGVLTDWNDWANLNY